MPIKIGRDGKEYVQVNERVIMFKEKYPEGRIITEILKDTEDMVCMRCLVYVDSDEKTLPSAIGHAFERVGSTNVNKTSHLENCETSAIGRAIGFLGIGIGESIASAEEVQTAKMQQKEYDENVKTDAEIAEIVETLKSLEDGSDEKNKYWNDLHAVVKQQVKALK